MSLVTFFKQFELLSDAPNGVQRLRELILQLAVRGQLVPQDPEDEPAPVLLAEVRTQREGLIQQKIIKRDQTLPPIEPKECSLELPDNWKWERLGNIARFIDYRGKTPLKTTQGIKLITAKNVRMGFINNEPEEYISEETYEEWMTRGFPKQGDLLFTTEAPLGNVAMLLTDEKVALAQRIIDLQLFGNLFSPYFMFALMSPLLQNALLDNATGMTAQGIKAARLKLILIPVPPLAEQKRIVEKMDELMALCDRLEAQQNQRRSACIRINDGAITQLLTASAPEEFDRHWQRVCDNFDLFYSLPDNITKLRQAILQLAVMGKLVPQDPGDEPASQLVEKIKSVREVLVQEKKVKKSSALPPIKPAEIPYKLPMGWVWVRLDDISDIGTGSTPLTSKPEYYNGTIPWLTSTSTSRGCIVAADVHITEEAVADYRLRMYPEGTLIVALYGQGKTRGQVSELKIPATINQACAAVVFFKEAKILRPYTKRLFQQKYDELRDLAAGGAQPNLNVGKIKSMLVPLPPLAEQKRIVEKVDRLMTLCDQLEAQLNQAQGKSERLMEVAVRQILAA